MNALRRLHDFGQSVWLDYIRRSLMTSGELERLMEEDGLRGVTSNPAIFEKAITGSNDYADILEPLRKSHTDAMKSYEEIAIHDIRDAADTLRPVYEESNRRDGYVSLEVSPYLASDTKGTIKEAKRLWQALGRENVLIKVPATPEGIPAIEELISEGINVNVTLIFSRTAYDEVAEAYIAGLEKLALRGSDLGQVASVASFFVSRIDGAIDAALKAKKQLATTGAEKERIDSLLGKVAIANAKIAYQSYKQHFSGDRWEKLAQSGAQTQRVLWASTSTKDPSYRDVLYVEELIGSDTVNTIPPATFDEFRDHGEVRASLEERIDEAERTLETLEELGISLEEVTSRLLDDGLRQFSEAFDKLLRAVDSRCGCASELRITPHTSSLPSDLATEVEATIADWRENGKVRRLWARDASLWTNADESKWLGWLGITEDHVGRSERLGELSSEIKEAGFTHVLLLGMGGSSLCPDVLKSAFGHIEGFPELRVLDSTDPAQIEAVAEEVDLGRTLFIVSSKSGSTLEPNIFKQYFFDRVAKIVGKEQVASRFIAITDPGSHLEEVAKTDAFRDVYFGVPSIGGRYSALSDFGMVPAALMGIDAARFLDRADEMAVSCSACVPVEDNPGVVLGTILGVAGKSGRDKVTIVASPAIDGFGAWVEQLLAESTGKNGRGLIPVDREELSRPPDYGDDRVFVYVRLESAPDGAQDKAVSALEEAGHPVVRIPVGETYDLGREFFRWKVAAAVAGSILGVNPFDQPDVEASKVATRALTSQYEKTGQLPPEEPFFEEAGIKLFADPANTDDLRLPAGKASLADYLRQHLDRIRGGDYFAVLAYIEMNQRNEDDLQVIRHAVRDKYQAATCLGFGPRFLHSTGQAYKGGPNSGVFLQITCDDAKDIPVPGQKYTFGVVKAAQARGDFEVLAERERRALRVHLPADLEAGLAALKKAFQKALK